jgi:hypothetical protein
MTESDPSQGGGGTTGGASATERAQASLILRSVPEAVAWPPDWERSGVRYFYRRGGIVVRNRHRGRVEAALDAVHPERQALAPQVRSGTTLLRWAGEEGGPAVPEVLDRLAEEAGERIAAPDYLLYVCVHCCAASEQEVVPADADPFPPPRALGVGGPISGLGEGVKVVVLDTGLVPGAAADHAWLDGVTGDSDDPYLPDPAAPGTQLAQDGGHGTFTAGCVRVTAPRAQVHVVNAVDLLPRLPEESPIGGVFESDLADLLRSQLVAAPGQEPVQVPDIVVINFAGATADDHPPLALSALYDDVIQHLGEVLILAPAGNEGDTRKNWPASFRWVTSVGALDSQWLQRATWSNYGRTVDVYAPGEDLVNAFARGDYTCTWEPAAGEVRSFEGMARWSGTSFATPLVAGMIASRMSTTGQTSRRVWSSLRDLAERQAVPGVGPVLYP